MKVRASVKPICKDCKVIKRRGRVTVVCKKYPKHNKDKDSFCAICKNIKANLFRKVKRKQS